MSTMDSVSRLIRTRITQIVIVITLLSAVAGYFFSNPELNALNTELNLWNMNIITFTLFIGLITIFFSYSKSVSQRTTNWPFRLYALVLIAVWIVMGLYSGLYSNMYQTAFLSTKIALHIAILGQLIFFYLSAMYRTFRVKTLRTGILVISALVLVLLNSPLVLSNWSAADQISYWLLNNPGMGGARAVVLASGIGGIILAIRILMGIEKSALRAAGG